MVEFIKRPTLPQAHIPPLQLVLFMAENKLSSAGGACLKCCFYSFFIFIPLLTTLIRGTVLQNNVSAGYYGHLTKNGLTPFIVFIIFYFYPLPTSLIRETVIQNSTSTGAL